MRGLLLWIVALLSPCLALAASPIQHQFLAQSAAGDCGATCLRVVQVAARTTTGTEDFTVTDFGTPDGYLVSLTSGQTNGVANDNWIFGLGAGDTTNEWAGGTFDEHGLASADVGRTAGATSSIRLPNLIGGVNGEAVFSATITDGIRLNYPSNPLDNAYQVNMTLIKAPNVAAGTFTHTGLQDATQSQNVGFTVDVVLFFAVGQLFNQTEASFHKASIGVAVRGAGTTVASQWCAAHVADDNAAAADLGTRVHNNRVAINMNAGGGTIFEAGEITAFPANAFEMTKRDTGNDVRVAYLALGGVTAWAGVHSTPTSTGQQVVTSPSFRPQFLLGATGYVDTVNTLSSTNPTGAGSLGLFMADATNLYAHHVASEDAAATMNTQSMSTTGEILVADGAGTQVFDVDSLAMTASGWNWTFNTSVPGTARLWGMLAIAQ